MSAPLPSSPEVERLRPYLDGCNNPGQYIFEKICAAQHRASRRATLEEVDRIVTDEGEAFFRVWLTQQITECGK